MLSYRHKVNKHAAQKSLYTPKKGDVRLCRCVRAPKRLSAVVPSQLKAEVQKCRSAVVTLPLIAEVKSAVVPLPLKAEARSYTLPKLEVPPSGL